MGQLMDRLMTRLGADPESRDMRRAKVLASNDLELLASLVELRRRQNISQTDLAERLGITQASVAAFERTDNDPKLSTIRRYAQGVGALVVHTVALDEGQLEGAGASAWDAAKARRDGFTPIAINLRCVPFNFELSQTLASYIVDVSHATNSVRTDFAPVA